MARRKQSGGARAKRAGASRTSGSRGIRAKSGRARAAGTRTAARAGGRSGGATRRASSGRSTGRSAGRGRQPRRQDAIQLLKSDHREVEQLFEQFEKAREPKQRQLATQICRMLTIHAQIEEEIFYPAAREALRDKDLLDEAEVEHASAKDLIAQIEGAAGDDKFEARVKVLGEYVKHHVKEEESEMFKQVKRTRLDLAALGERLLARKQQLLQGTGAAAAASSRGATADEADDDMPTARPNGTRGGRTQPVVLNSRGGRGEA